MKPPGGSAAGLAGGRAAKVACLLLAVCLGGCAACAPAPTGEVVPVAVPCGAARPLAPALPVVPAQGIFAQVQALLAREQLHAAYTRQMEIVLAACGGS